MPTGEIGSSVARWARLAGTVLLVAACSGGGSGSGPTSSTSVAQTPQRITIANLKLVPKTGVFSNRIAKIEFTVDASNAGLVVGGVARLRLIAARETTQGQTPASPFVSLADIRAANVVGNRIRVLMEVKLPKGRNRVGFSVARGPGARSTAPTVAQVQVGQDGVEVESNEITGAQVKAVDPVVPTTGTDAGVTLPQVNIAGGGSLAFGDCTTLTVTRTGDTSAALVVFFHTSGDASVGADFTISPGPDKLTIPAGSASVTITVCASDYGTPAQFVFVRLDENISTYTVGVGLATVIVP